MLLYLFILYYSYFFKFRFLFKNVKYMRLFFLFKCSMEVNNDLISVTLNSPFFIS